MEKLYDAMHERARKNESMILQGLASVGQAALAETLGVSESTVSRMKDGEIARTALMLARCNLKVVPAKLRCFDPKEIEALLLFARKHMSQMEVQTLEWNDEEAHG